MKVTGMRVGLALVLAVAVVGVGARVEAAAPGETRIDLRIADDHPRLSEAIALEATVQRTRTARPTGTITFYVDGTTPIATAPLRASAVPRDTVKVWTRAIPVGRHEITAVYSGDTRYPGVTSREHDVDVRRGETTTTLRSALPEVATGKTARFIARVSPVAPATATPTGSVEFRAGDVVRSVPLVNGIATWRPRLPDGPHRVVARFDATDEWLVSASPTIDQRIGPVPVPEIDVSVISRADDRLMISSPGTFLAAAQVFTAGRTGTLTSVEVDGGCFGAIPGPGSGPSLPLWIKALSGESPTGAILATGGEPSGYDETLGLLRFDLATPVPVTQGTRYAIVIAPASGSLGCDIGLAADGRSLVQSGSVWSAMGHTSLRFRTWVERP